MKKPSRTKVERAIYTGTSGIYSVISYDKIAKGTRTLAKFENIDDARAYRDANLRQARYGKGIQARKVKNGYRFDADISIYVKNTDKSYNIHIGTYATPTEARTARLQFIENLK